MREIVDLVFVGLGALLWSRVGVHSRQWSTRILGILVIAWWSVVLTGIDALIAGRFFEIHFWTTRLFFMAFVGLSWRGLIWSLKR
jgi:hypothetical protein